MARTRPAIRVHLSIADHDKAGVVWADLEMRGMLVELWRKAGEKYAGKRNDKVPLKPTDRMEIACSIDPEEADMMLLKLCSAMKYAVRKYPNRWVVTVRNFARKQGYQGQELEAVPESRLPKNSTPPIPSPNPIPKSDSNTEKEESTEPLSSASPPLSALRVNGSEKGKKPASFDGDDRVEITAWAEKKGYSRATLNAALELFREWEPLKQQSRTHRQWVAAFKRICRDSVESGKIGNGSNDRKPKGLAYSEWDGLKLLKSHKTDEGAA